MQGFIAKRPLELQNRFPGPEGLITERPVKLQNRFPGPEEFNVGCAVMSAPRGVIIEQPGLFGAGITPTFKGQAPASPPWAFGF